MPSESLEAELLRFFKIREFREGQRPIIEALLRGEDALAVLPTGGGKSLCYQFVAVSLSRLVVVVSPLIALMEDQVQSLKALGLPAGALHSGQSQSENRKILEDARQPGPYVLYIAPERLQSKDGFLDWLSGCELALFAIDEAHCISQWGHDFRTDYHRLDELRQAALSDFKRVPILALTATATPIVLDDISKRLGLRHPLKFVASFYRQNLFIEVATCESDIDKEMWLAKTLEQVTDGRILVYGSTRNVVEELADRYSGCAGGVGFYHAGLTSNERKTTQTRFSEGAIKILFATTAFGMGVDYADIRAVIHYNIPASIESYYQEIGRAGRDGKMSTALLLYAKRDKGLQAYFIRRTNGRFVDPKITAAKWRGLEKLAALLESQTCRHIGILSHFSDRSIAIECGHCDVCDPSSEHMIRVNEKKLAKLRRGVQRWATSTRE